MKNLPLLRPRVSPPKAACEAFLDTRDKRLALHDLQDRIWREFQSRLRKPVRILNNRKYRIVEVLGCVRYFINKHDGKIHVHVRTRPGRNAAAFLNPDHPFLVDLPLRLNAFVVDAFLKEWEVEIFDAGPGFMPQDQSASSDPAGFEYEAQRRFHEAFVHSFLRAIRQSVYWKRLRYRVRDAFAIDPELLEIARQARPERHGNNLSNRHFNEIIEQRDQYLRLFRESPGQVWLFALALREGREIEGDILQSLKANLIDEGVGKRGWRLLVKSRHRDVAHAVDGMKYRWQALLDYVRLHNALDRNRPIPRKAHHLFEEPEWHAGQDGGIEYRGIQIPPAVLNAYIEATLEARDVQEFLAVEAAPVFTWLSESRPDLDSNQCKRGWGWLRESARRWSEDESKRKKFTRQGWETGLGETVIGGYRFVPLTDAWQVVREAVTYRHCADRYIDLCSGGQYRLFAVHDISGKHKATLGLKWAGSSWRLDQVKGFANQPVSGTLLKISASLADGLDLVGEGERARAAKDGGREELEAGQAEDESAGNACPVCGDPDGCCGHLLASFNLHFDGLYDGIAHDAIKSWYDIVSGILQICLEKQLFKTGLGRDFDNILVDFFISYPGSCIVNPASLEEYRMEIELSLCRLLANENGVRNDINHFNGAVFENYWAENPDKVISAVGEHLEDCLIKAGRNPGNLSEAHLRKDSLHSGPKGGLHP